MKNKGIPSLNVVETCLVFVFTQLWAVDSGATDHICTFLQGFQETRRPSKDEVCVFQANREPTPVLTVEIISVSLNNSRFLVLNNVLYAPSIRRNLLSVARLMDDGYDVYLHNNNAIISHNNFYIHSAPRVQNLFVF